MYSYRKGVCMEIGYFNGKIAPLEEMTVPMNDRAVYFGDGIYEATYSNNGIIYALKAQRKRSRAVCPSAGRSVQAVSEGNDEITYTLSPCPFKPFLCSGRLFAS